MAGQFVENESQCESMCSDLVPLLKTPGQYKVVLVNDDYTPMEFVVSVLTRFFHLGENAATDIMLQVHLQGKAVCGVFKREIAETKVHLVNEYARAHEHPLLCCMEPD